jgi:SAM-dependent methyltransferase
MDLLSNEILERSPVVANCRMNRERDLVGSNGYDRELGFHPLDFLKQKLAHQDHVVWLDLCCGTGKALIQAARIVRDEGLEARIAITGVDLVGVFHRAEPGMNSPQLVEASLSGCYPDRASDLITCVHGLHYIGDKLALIARAASWLTRDGLLVANFDHGSIKQSDGRPAGRRFLSELRRNGLSYDSRRRRLTGRGKQKVELPYRYLGADDRAGPNYTGQPAVDSFYEYRTDPINEPGAPQPAPRGRADDRTAPEPAARS